MHMIAVTFVLALTVGCLVGPISGGYYDYEGGAFFWVGASDFKNEGSWRWTNNQPLSRDFPWISGEPNGGRTENCVHVWSQKGYNDWRCSKINRYICEENTISFGEFISKYRLVFENNAEKVRRIQIFSENLKEIQNHNILYDTGLTSYKKGVNRFAHLTYEEFISKYTGIDASAAEFTSYGKRSERNSPVRSQYKPRNDPRMPLFKNWTAEGVVNPIRNQGNDCLSCWAFSATSVIESQIKKEFGVLPKLSEQYLIDCDHSNLEHGCHKGWPAIAINFATNNGIALRSEYQYTGKPGEPCKPNTKQTSYSIAGHQYIKHHSDEDLLDANSHVGPISVCIHYSPNSRFYDKGVFYEPNDCSQSNKDLVNHAMVLVGYGTERGTDGKDRDYWLLRNSYGPEVGDNGYMKLSRSKHHPDYCSISSHAVFPVIHKVPECVYPWFQVGDQCFYVVIIAPGRSWSLSRVYCGDLISGADLAQPKDLQALENALVARGDNIGRYWLGASDLKTEGDWRWLDNTVIPTYGWYPGQPNNAGRGGGEEDCLSWWPGSDAGERSFEDRDCASNLNFICHLN